MPIKTLCIFSGSSSGHSDIYRTATIHFVTRLVKQEISIVYGGASVGLMGVAAECALELHGTVIGVLPETLTKKEIAHKNLTKLHIVSSMHERKKLMYDLSDAFVALPGGFGTLDEFFEILTWAQLGLHQKPCGILNVNGYFDALLEFLDNTVKEGFLRQLNREMIVVGSTSEQLLDRLKHYIPKNVTKFIDKDEV